MSTLSDIKKTQNQSRIIIDKTNQSTSNINFNINAYGSEIVEVKVTKFTTFNDWYLLTNENCFIQIDMGAGYTTYTITPGVYETIGDLISEINSETGFLFVDDPIRKRLKHTATGTVKKIKNCLFYNILGLSSSTQEVIFTVGNTIALDNQYDLRRIKWLYVKSNLPNINRLCEGVTTYDTNILEIITIDSNVVNYINYEEGGYITINASSIKNGFQIWIEDQNEQKIDYMDYFLEILIKH